MSVRTWVNMGGTSVKLIVLVVVVFNGGAETILLPLAYTKNHQTSCLVGKALIRPEINFGFILGGRKI